MKVNEQACVAAVGASNKKILSFIEENFKKMKIEKNKVVSLAYRLTETDAGGQLIEEVTDNQPFIFLFGSGNLIPGFEKNVINLKTGDSFAFSIASDDAYGPYDEQGLVELPVDIFFHEGKLDTELCKVGNMIPMRNESGQHLNGKVMSVTDENVLMDFNHPLAGKNLHFTGTVLSVREATPEELNHGHHHHHSGQSSCGCSH